MTETGTEEIKEGAVDEEDQWCMNESFEFFTYYVVFLFYIFSASLMYK